MWKLKLLIGQLLWSVPTVEASEPNRCQLRLVKLTKNCGKCFLKH